VQERDFSKLTKNFSFWHINLEILRGKGKLIVNMNKIMQIKPEKEANFQFNAIQKQNPVP
jgi:hypothetical protein